MNKYEKLLLILSFLFSDLLYYNRLFTAPSDELTNQYRKTTQGEFWGWGVSVVPRSKPLHSSLFVSMSPI